MTKQELITILSKSDTPSSKKVVISVEHTDGTLEYLDIDTFTICSDRISLNVKSGLNTTPDCVNVEPNHPITEMDQNRPITEKVNIVEEADDRWMYDYYNSNPHNHFLKKLDCIVFEDSLTHNAGVLFVTSFDYEADCAARGITQCSNGSWYVAAPAFCKYRFATEDEITKVVNSLDTQIWRFAGNEFRDKYNKYLKK